MTPTATAQESGRPVRLACFDWGGVILKHCRNWGEACRVAGMPLREGWDHSDRVVKRRALHHRFHVGDIEEAEFFAGLAAANDGLYTPAECRTLHEAWLTEEYPGVRSVIERLVAVQGVETALLSNTNAAHWARHMPKACGTIDFPTAALLKHRHASHLLKCAKPHAEIYRAFENATGFRGSEILFFDDLPDNIAAAHTLGWRAELIDHTGDTAAQIEHHLRRYGVFADGPVAVG